MALMDRKLEERVLTKITSLEQEVEQMKFALHLHGPKRSQSTYEIYRRYTHSPSFLNHQQFTSTPLSQNVNSLYKEMGLRPMNPAYYKSHDLISHQNPAKSSMKKKIANKAKGGNSSGHGRRH
ncbi:unnamed protein product [Cylicocyclus nassatus]|uniref:Uncharacterized protein n=1 Tax=Cylicocyclus nassatus TaxID=53992 RepID=A0AA36MER0_CYLNA|nr:unnamed protein product [Cylicocyclus nassatus]